MGLKKTYLHGCLDKKEEESDDGRRRDGMGLERWRMVEMGQRGSALQGGWKSQEWNKKVIQNIYAPVPIIPMFMFPTTIQTLWVKFTNVGLKICGGNLVHRQKYVWNKGIIPLCTFIIGPQFMYAMNHT